MTDPQTDPTAPIDGLSHVHGPDEPPLQHITIPALLRQAVEQHGSREALVFTDAGIRMTYAELARKADELAAGLLELGVAKGDRVGIWSPNRCEWVLTQFATARIGAILVTINPAYRLAELEYALNKTGCKVLIAAESFKSSNYLGMIRELAPELAAGPLSPARLPALRYAVVMAADTGPGVLSFETVQELGAGADTAELDTISAGLKPEEAINIQFTSGTTGLPKGATLTHFNIVNNARFVTDRIKLTEADRLLIPVPLYHCFGMVMGVLGAVSKGATMIFPGEAFEPGSVLEAAAAEHATALYGVPTMFVAMLQELDQNPRDIASLRTGIMAGAPCPIEIMHRANRDMHMQEVTICYGMTETAPVSFQSFTTDPTEKRCTTVGRVHPHLEVKAVDAEGRTVPAGEQGELLVRGYSVMESYWDDPAATEAVQADGWMRTGDLATIDTEGFCSITGRIKDMIIRGGENIYPREIEEFLLRHPEVGDAQVFGVPDQRFGEQVCAWIVPATGASLTEDQILTHCRGQIAHFKVPHYVRIVAELPMTVTGKPQKFKMREAMVQQLALS
ncbi:MULTISPECIES: AMP-binding protein [unclassified Leisingera]|uniref:AMP-binding protein n=1 Tax=unclassified Leisingera TaxID=2614906 RepID=UPI000314AEFB|nr:MULTISPECIES: AMP-binding protein [unclassified Leisingera]KIC23004.1 AMP-binding protein [Leisingera sp. ANG-S3]KIC52416.1 AMP-binding protein [Leisingera sp. ANG-S]KID07433.1 AMP-binding protein [Leisingera sp. ANG1]